MEEVVNSVCAICSGETVVDGVCRNCGEGKIVAEEEDTTTSTPEEDTTTSTPEEEVSTPEEVSSEETNG